MIVFGSRHRRIIDALDVGDDGPRTAPPGYMHTAKIADAIGESKGSVAGHLRIMAGKGWVTSVMSGGRKAWAATPEGRHLAMLERLRRENMGRRGER